MEPSPLSFVPVYQQYLWGGNRLRTLFQKPCPGPRCAESWEIVDHQHGQSIVAHGPYVGQSLSQLIAQFGPELLGEKTWHQIQAPHLPANLRGRFPLLLKFLDAALPLSVQVHPNDKQGAQLSPADLGKTEAWYIVHAEPESLIYAGLNQVVTPEQLQSAITGGFLAELLHAFHPQPGDVVYIPAGTIHALGAGLVVAEIQQASNTTFRLFDWNRVDEQGKSRPLHVEQAAAVALLDQGPVKPQRSTDRSAANQTQTDRDFTWHSRVTCPYFQLESLTGRGALAVSTQHEFMILTMVAGQAQLRWQTRNGEDRIEMLGAGESRLVPACLENFEIELMEKSTLLRVMAGR
jgi:mannose-6-phosphate isomerase